VKALHLSFFLVTAMGESSPLPILAVGMLGMLSIVLAVSLGVIESNERTLFTAVFVVVFAVVALTFASLAYEEHEPDECVFEDEHA
jgi:hypothetical protein